MLMQANKLLTPPQSRAQMMIRRFSAIGLGIVFLLFGVFGTWMATAQLSGAVIASGQLVVETSLKAIQHQTGGIVKDILVENGDIVKAGDVLIRLDDTVARSNRDIYRSQVDEMLARQARLVAVAAGHDQVEFGPELAPRADEPGAASLMQRETNLFQAQQHSSESKEGQLNERIGQIEQEISGLEAQSQAKRDEADLVHSELDGLRNLYAKGLVPVSQLNDMERQSTQLDGQNGDLVAQIARARGQIIETRLQITQFKSDIRNQALQDLADTQAQLAEMRERLTAAEDQLRRVNITAPRDGVVHQLQVHTVGGVIGAGETIMQIIPTADALVVDARVAPTDIDQLRVGARVRLQIHAGDQRSTPDLWGTLTRVDSDLTQDQQTGAHYYAVRATLPSDAQETLGDLTLVPGMPATGFIQTESRTMLQYLFKPLIQQIERAFKER